MFPAIDIPKIRTRREDLLLTKEEQDAVYIMRKAMNGMKSEEAVDNLFEYVFHYKNKRRACSADHPSEIYLKGIALLKMCDTIRKLFRENNK